MHNDSTAALVESLSGWVAGAAPGTQLPPSRSLVAEHAVSPQTVQKVVRTLRDRGLVEVRPGAGAFVLAPRIARPIDYGWQTAALGVAGALSSGSADALRPASNDLIALHTGYPDPALLPERLIRAAIARASRLGTVATRAQAAGLPDLRSWFAGELGEAYPAGLTPPSSADVIVLTGTQGGLGAAFRALAGPDRPLIVESPTYWGAVLAATRAGIPLVPIPSGPGGPDPRELERALVRTGARAFYAQPNFANPTGAQWSPEIRSRVLELVRAHGAFVIEDDYAHDFGIDTTAIPLAADDDDGHVVYIRSLTKSLSPALRIGALIARGPAHQRILAQVEAESLYTSPVLQSAALDVVTQPGWRRHQRGLGGQLRARRDLLIDALRTHAPRVHLIAKPTGGLGLWTQLDDRVDLARLQRDTESNGLIIATRQEWFPAEPPGAFLRLTFSGPDPHRYPEGAQILEGALAAQDLSHL